MTEAMHIRSQQLIAQQRVEGISETNRHWLDAHLQSCPTCADLARQTDYALRSLRSASIPLPSGLASRTQFRVRLRAQELQEREPRLRLLWLISGISWALGIVSAPYVWQAFAWIGQRTGAPKLVLQFGFSLWWAIPALFAAAIVLFETTRQADETGWSGQRK